MLRFSARLFFFYITTLIVWFFIHSYYEKFLFFFTIEASQVFGHLHFTGPEIIKDVYVYHLENGVFRLFSMESITFNMLITIPLLLASSGISFLNRIKMIVIGFLLLFLFQSLFLLIVQYEEIYRNYPIYFQKGIKLDKVIVHTPVKSWMLLQLKDFFNTIFKFVVSLGIWIGLVSHYKKSEKTHWIRKLL